MKRWVVGAGDGSTVAEIVGDASAVAEGRVFVGRKRVQDATFVVKPGDVVTMGPPAAETSAEVAILERTVDLLAVHKPAGIPTIPDQGGASHALVVHAARLAGVPASSLHPTSRLDRDVSGVVVFAQTPAGAERLVAARAAGTYSRRYVAVATRAPSPERGTWDAPIGRAKDPKLRAVNGADAKAARTAYAVVAVAPGGQALLAVAPVTGRTHQIRVHAGHAAAPLLGDRAYGGPPRLALPTGRVVSFDRIFLHCARVAVPGLLAVAPVPPALRETWAALGGDPAAWDTAVECAIDA